MYYYVNILTNIVSILQELIYFNVEFNYNCNIKK